MERLQRAPVSVWHDPSVSEITAADLAGAYPVVRFVAPDGVQIDLLSRVGEAFAFDDLESIVSVYGDLEVVVATSGPLYRMKHDTSRLQDKARSKKSNRMLEIEPLRGISEIILLLAPSSKNIT